MNRKKGDRRNLNISARNYHYSLCCINTRERLTAAIVHVCVWHYSAGACHGPFDRNFFLSFKKLRIWEVVAGDECQRINE